MARRMDLEEAVSMFLQEKAEEGKAPRTLVAYGQTLRSAVKILQKLGVTKVYTITGVHMHKLIYDDKVGFKRPDPATGRIISPGHLNNHIQRVKVFLSWCQDAGLLDENPARKIKRAQWNGSKKLYLTPAQCDEIVAAARHPRDKALYEIAIYSAMRVGDILDLRVGDIDFDRQEIQHIEDKGEKRMVRPAWEELLIALSRWLLEYERLLGAPLQPDMYLIPRVARPTFTGSRQVCAMEDRALDPYEQYKGGYAAVNKVLTELGLKAPNQAFHTFRRSTGRIVYEKLCDEDGSSDKALRMVQKFYGHSQRSTTEKYLSLDAEAEELNHLIKGQSLFPKPPGGGMALPDNVIQFDREAEAG